MSSSSSRFVVFALLVSALACQRGSAPDVDWKAAENFFVVEKVDKGEGGATRLEFHSLVDAPADGVYGALAEPENYAAFVEGVTDSGKMTVQGNVKVTHITQTVIGRQNRAEVEWTLHPEAKRIEFKTLKSDLNYNDGSYEVIPSPDGKRAYVISVYNLREKEGGIKAPPGVAVSATRESFAAAARSVKKRAAGG
jgi:hypothetical protein